ncbi:MAG TPA: YbaK/EbsC family protein [Gemmatales bacterium]|nr:YbaK/EbsC family protein [Gemmatales bacterium]HMP61090.1 YbaK/EbsC family protein [Gemmatales bacterium]
MATLGWVKELLQRRQIPFEEVHHDPAFTAQELAHREHVTGHCVAKVVMIWADDRLVELVLPASRQVVFSEVRSLLDAHEIRLATEPEMQTAFVDCEPGAMPPLPHVPNVEVLLDEALATDGMILIQAGTHRDAIKLHFNDWLQVVNPRIESFSEPAGATHEELYPTEVLAKRPAQTLSPASEAELDELIANRERQS